jgi:hypothetical protein
LKSARADSAAFAAQAVPSHEPQSRSRPPFPGSRKLNEILENVRADMAATDRDRLPGLSRIHDLASLKVTRFIEVKADAPKDEYYLIDLDTLDDKPFLSVLMGRDSGLILSIAWNFANGERGYKPAALETVADRLKTLYGVANVTYYYIPDTTIYDGGASPL